MKNLIALSLLFSSLILLWGCPYASDVSLGPVVEKISGNIIGTWLSEAEMNVENPSYYTITKYDSLRYEVIHFQYQEEEKEYSPKNYIGHTTNLDGFVFMNLIESGTKQYLMHRIEYTPNGFKFYEVTDNIDEKFESTADMQAFFRKNMRLSFFYNKNEVTLVRK